MADMLPETFSSYYRSWTVAGNEISTAALKFSESSNTVGLVWILSDVGVTGQANMAAINRKYTFNTVYPSLYLGLQQDYNGYNHHHIFGAQQHGGTSVNTLLRWCDWSIKDGCH